MKVIQPYSLLQMVEWAAVFRRVSAGLDELDQLLDNQSRPKNLLSW